MLIEDVLPPGGLFQIFGQTGEYKSFIAVAMLGAVANGVDWLGKKVNRIRRRCADLGRRRLRRRRSAQGVAARQSQMHS